MELERDIWCFERHIQAVEEETHRYGWVMKKKEGKMAITVGVAKAKDV